MTETATIDGGCSDRRPENGPRMPQDAHGAALLRSVLSGTRLLDRVVRSLFARVPDLVPLQQISFSFLLLKPTQALMLAGIRCAGAGGGGPGH